MVVVAARFWHHRPLSTHVLDDAPAYDKCPWASATDDQRDAWLDELAHNEAVLRSIEAEAEYELLCAHPPHEE